MKRWLRRVSVTMAAAMAGATGAHADVLPPGGGPIPPRQAVLNGTVAELTEGHITLDGTQLRGRQSFRFPGPVHQDALGLRLGDRVAVLLIGHGNPFAAPVAAVDRVLPVADLRLRVYTADASIEPAALGQGPGCWVADENSVEVCFVSSSDAVALRYADGKLACSARLAPAADRARWAVTAAPSCSGGARWTLTGLSCDSAAQACTAEGAGGKRLAMTRR
jgi:hypothetical protein